jgi:hypothetical protein
VGLSKFCSIAILYQTAETPVENPIDFVENKGFSDIL